MRRGAWLVAGMLAMSGCSSEPPTDEVEGAKGFYVDAAPPTKAQAEELAALGEVDEAAFEPGSHALQLLRGPHLAQASGDPGGTAVAFALGHPAIFLSAALRVDSVRDEPDGTVVHTSQL